MRHLLRELDSYNLILGSKQISLFLDYDGTLAPITQIPEKAFIPKAVKNVLSRISTLSQIHVTVISGRSLGDVRNQVGVTGINYVGNHGYEIKGPKIEFEVLPSPEYKTLLIKLQKEISQKLTDFPGSFIEDKGTTISIHYRQVTSSLGLIFEHLLFKMTERYFKKNEICINLGKKVFEIRPPDNWNKGKAVKKIMETEKGFPIYLGDDTTDEDAFLIVKDIGIAVNVGGRDNSHAKYYLKSTEEVVTFLEYLYEVKNVKKNK